MSRYTVNYYKRNSSVPMELNEITHSEDFKSQQPALDAANAATQNAVVIDNRENRVIVKVFKNLHILVAA